MRPPEEPEQIPGYVWMETRRGLVAWRLDSNLLNPPDVQWSALDWWGFRIRCSWQRIRWAVANGRWGSL